MSFELTSFKDAFIFSLVFLDNTDKRKGAAKTAPLS